MRTNADDLRRFPAPLYQHYLATPAPQDAYVEIDPKTRTALAAWDPEPPGILPARVRRGLCIRQRIPPTLSGHAIAAFLESSAFQALAERIVEGHRLEWDGHAHVGRCTPDARDAIAELAALAAQLRPDLATQTLRQWATTRVQPLPDAQHPHTVRIEGAGDVRLDTPDPVLDDIASRLSQTALAEAVILTDARPQLAAWRDTLRRPPEDDDDAD